MTNPMTHRFRLAAPALALCAAFLLAACGGEDRSGAEYMPVVTVYGQIERADRGPSDAAIDPFFNLYGIEFERARAFSRDELAVLPQQVVTVDFPAGGQTRRFEGPRLSDVLAAAGAENVHATVTALDGYQRTIPAGRIASEGVILAIRMDGDILHLGGFGPGVLVWPRRDDPALAGMNDDDWVWGVFAIEAQSAESR